MIRTCHLWHVMWRHVILYHIIWHDMTWDDITYHIIAWDLVLEVPDRWPEQHCNQSNHSTPRDYSAPPGDFGRNSNNTTAVALGTRLFLTLCGNMIDDVLLFTGNSTWTGIRGDYSRVTFTFHIRRKPRYYIINLIIPCCLLSFITVAAFILPSSASERLGVSM